jgi:hypothetical protein
LGQLEFMQALERGVQETNRAALQGVPVDVGYALLRERLAGAAQASWWQRLRGWLVLPSPQGWRLAQGLSMGLALGLGSMLALQGASEAPESQSSGVRSTAPALAEGPLLRVSFDAAASESSLRLALIEARSLIVAGPTRLGDYYLKPASGQLAEARATLLRSGVVRQADEVPGLPPELVE